MQRRNVKDFPLSNADFLDLRNGARNNFEDFAAVNTFRATLPGLDGSPERVRIAAVSTNFFQMIVASIIPGRHLQESDGTAQPAAPAPAAGGATAASPPLPTMAILSNQYFQQRFGGDRSVIGKLLPVSVAFGPAPTIVGVLAPGFELLFPPQVNIEQSPSLWFAARIPYDTANRNNVQWRVIARLKPSVAIGQAQAEAETIAEKIREENTIARTAGQYFRLEPMKQHLVNEVRPAILALMGAVIFLLLIACANVANLMLVRASLRERELAVRAALGGSWWRLMRQMLMEAALLSGVGTLLGVGLAWLGTHALLAVAPANLPRVDSVAIDWCVLAFAAMTGLTSAALFGAIPAWRGSSPDVMQVLRGGGRAAGSPGGRRLRSSVVIAEIALSFVLLIGSGLMFRS